MLHKTPAEAGQLTLPELDRLMRYWARQPPPGYTRAEESKPTSEEDMKQLVGWVNNGG